MKKVTLVLLLSVAFALSQNAVDTEMKLQAIYNQHAESSERIGQHLMALMNKNCADLHATAAEMIIAHPAKAKIVSAAVKHDCDEMIRRVPLEEAKA